MPTKLVRYRRSAYVAQSGYCFYCEMRMWDNDLKSFSLAYNIKPSLAKMLKCTAEHLKARKVGGNDCPQNIVAACFICNSRRHRRKRDLSPDAYRQLVQEKLSKGRWHCAPLMRKFKMMVK